MHIAEISTSNWPHMPCNIYIYNIHAQHLLLHVAAIQVCHPWVAIVQSVQRLAMGWMVRGSNPGGGEIFRTRPYRPWGPPSLPYNGYRVFPWDKAAGAWRWPSTHSRVEVKERVELYLYSTSGPSWSLLGWPLPLPLLCVPTSIQATRTQSLPGLKPAFRFRGGSWTFEWRSLYLQTQNTWRSKTISAVVVMFWTLYERFLLCFNWEKIFNVRVQECDSAAHCGPFRKHYFNHFEGSRMMAAVQCRNMQTDN